MEKEAGLAVCVYKSKPMPLKYPDPIPTFNNILSFAFKTFTFIYSDITKMPSMDSLSLAGKTAIVTGSGKENGIGAAIALALARNGARVVINYVSETTAPRAAKVADSIEAVAGKGSAVAIQQDISTPEGTKKLVAEAISAFGIDRIDILGKY